MRVGSCGYTQKLLFVLLSSVSCLLRYCSPPSSLLDKIMNVIRYLIQRPVAVMMVTIAVVVLGGLALSRLPVSLLPDVDIPQITVQVSRPGASAGQIDGQIVEPLRSRLAQLTGLKDMETVARMDAATITLKFAPGSNIDLIFIDVNEKIDMAMGTLPKDIERPKVMKSSVTDIPAFFIDLTLKDSPGDMGKFAELCDYAGGVVRKRIEQLPQTAMVDISGTVGQKIVIIPDYDAMRSMGLTTDDIEKALSDNDVYVETLSVKDGQYRYNIHFDAQLLTADDIASIRINHEGRILRLDDFCRIEQKTGVRNGWVRHDGKNAVTMAVIKQSDARMADLRSGIETTIADLQRQNPGIDFAVTRDQTRLLSFSMENLESNLVVGALLTCLVLLVFMRNWRLAMLVALTIPLSLVITSLAFYVMGISLNVISLSGLILGVGMIVDNSIVVTDNIMQKWGAGQRLVDVVPRCTAEVFTPMLSSVLTTCSVFVPLVFLSGLAGELFYDQSVGISISLLTSLLIAMTIVPVCVYRMFGGSRKPKNTEPTKFDDALTRIYERGTAFTLRHGRAAMVLFGLSLPGLVIMYMVTDKQRMPEVSYDDAQVVVNWNEGISEEEGDRRMAELMGAAGNAVQTTSSMAGTQQFILSHTPAITASEGIGYMKCGSPAALDEAKRRIRAYADSAFSRATVAFEPTGNPFDLMLDTKQSPLEVRLQDSDGGRPAVAAAEAFTDSLRRRFPGVYVPQVAVDDNLALKADTWQMAIYGITYQSLLTRLRELTGSNSVMEINAGTVAVPVVIGADGADRDRVMQATVSNRQGVEVPLGFILRDSVVKDFKHLYASASGGYYPVQIDADGGTVRHIMAYTDSLRTERGDFSTSYVGDYFASRELVEELLVVLSVALLLLFFIMAAQFESLIQPLIILSEIALDCFVVLLVMQFIDMSLNLMSMIGLVVMSGIVINDSILKIDTINRLRRSGMSTLRAIVTAGHERLRPILMTASTTMFAVLPFLSRGDIGSDLQYPISITTIVGMTVGTLVSLFFVPLLYYVIYRRR